MVDRYRKRLKQDLDRWISAGLVPAENRAAILDDVSAEPAQWSAPGAAAILGAVLLGLASLSFVAANWAELERAVRFALIITALWASFGGAAFAFARGNSAIGHALALLGATLFGGAIALTAQTFNLSAFRNTGVLIWAIGALGAALAIPSRPVLILAAAVSLGWLVSEAQNPLGPPITWIFPLIFLAGAAAASRLQSSAAMNLLAVSLGGWIVHMLHEIHPVYRLDGAAASASFALISAAIALAAGALRDRAIAGAGVVAGWAVAGAAGGVFALQIGVDARDPSLSAAYPAIAAPALVAALALTGFQAYSRRIGRASAAALAGAGVVSFALPFAIATAGDGLVDALQFALGALVFAAATALILLGAAPGRRLTGAAGAALFIAQAIYVYAELFGGLLGTAAFFFVGGVLMIALSVALGRIAQRLGRGDRS